MKKVYKYPVLIKDTVTLVLPRGAELLMVEPQYNGEIEWHLWALVDPMQPVLEQRTLRLAGTGHPIEGNVKHINSFQMENGALVFHVFEQLL